MALAVRYMHRDPTSFRVEQRIGNILTHSACLRTLLTGNGHDRTDRFCPSSDQLARTPPAVLARAVSEEIHSSSFTKDSEFWFEDGTIVLVSQNVGFRVYKQELAERSPLFSDLLSIPQPAPAGSEETSDCPVISLTDPPYQLRHLFRALFSSGGHVT